MQGWGAGRGGGGVGGDPGPDSPSSLVAAEVGGGCPRLGRAVGNILSPIDSTESPGNRPWAQSGVAGPPLASGLV